MWLKLNVMIKEWMSYVKKKYPKNFKIYKILQKIYKIFLKMYKKFFFVNGFEPEFDEWRRGEMLDTSK